MAYLTIAWHYCGPAAFSRTAAEDSDEEGEWMEVDGLFDEPKAATNGSEGEAVYYCFTFCHIDTYLCVTITSNGSGKPSENKAEAFVFDGG